MIIILLVPICVYWRHWGDGWLSVMSDIIDNYLIRLNNYFCSLYISHWPHIATLQDSERHISQNVSSFEKKKLRIWDLVSPCAQKWHRCQESKSPLQERSGLKKLKTNFATISKWTWRTVEWNAVILFATKLLNIL